MTKNRIKDQLGFVKEKFVWWGESGGRLCCGEVVSVKVTSADDGKHGLTIDAITNAGRHVELTLTRFADSESHRKVGTARMDRWPDVTVVRTRPTKDRR